MRFLRNGMFVLFFLIAGTSGLAGSSAVDVFVQAYNCDTPHYWSTGSCINGGVTLECSPGEYYGFFCEDADFMCEDFCQAENGVEGNLDGCFATAISGLYVVLA